MAEGSPRPSVMYFIYSAAVCLAFIQGAAGLPWSEEKVSVEQEAGAFVTILPSSHTEMEILLRQATKMPSAVKTNSTLLVEILSFIFVSVTSLKLFGSSNKI